LGGALEKSSKGIARHNTTPYTLQQNGVIKDEQDIDGKIKEHAHGVRLGQEFWAEAVDTTNVTW
jgi:hypothetical protein